MDNCAPTSHPSVVKTSRPTNENTVTIQIPSGVSEGAPKAITLNPQPLSLKVDTSTDWPAVAATSFVGLSGAAIALLVGMLAYSAQRNQVRSATANFRHSWQIELRESVAKFIAIVARIHFELDSNPDYLNSSESNSEYCSLIEMHAKITLMLDRKKDYSEQISHLTAELVQKVKERETHEFAKLNGELLKAVNSVLEQAWQDIRRDLKGKSQ